MKCFALKNHDAVDSDNNKTHSKNAQRLLQAQTDGPGSLISSVSYKQSETNLIKAIVLR